MIHPTTRHTARPWSLTSTAGLLALTVVVILGVVASILKPGPLRRVSDTAQLKMTQIGRSIGLLATPLIVVNPSVTYQTIVGWEGSYGPYKYLPIPNLATFQGTAFDLAVNELGITRLRFEIPMAGPGQRSEFDCPVPRTDGWDFTCFDTIMDGAVQFKRLVEARGDRFWLNVTVVGSKGSSSPEAYAQEALAIYQHLQQRYGFLPDSWEVALEPGMFRWDSATTLARAMLMTAMILEQHGFSTPYFIGPSSECGIPTALEWFDRMANIPGAITLIKEFSYHRYCAPSDTDLMKVADLGRTYSINTSQLEFIGASYKELHDDLKKANVAAWQQYLLFFPAAQDKGGQYIIVDNPEADSPTIRLASRSNFLRQYFLYIRPGALRIEATSNDSRIDPVAFLNGNGTQVVVVKTDGESEFSIAGLRPGRYGVKFTTENAYDVDRADIDLSEGDNLTASIPGAGVITIFGK